MRRLLNAHPDIYIADEAGLHGWVRQLPGSFRDRVQAYFQTFSFRWLYLSPDLLQDEIEASGEDVNRFWLAMLKHKAAQYGRRRFGEKNPFYTLELEAFLEVHPDLRVVRMMRDPRANLAGYRRMPWAPSSLIALIHLGGLIFSKSEIADERVLTVRLEDLVQDIEGTMRNVLDHVGENWSNRVLDHASHGLPQDGLPFPWMTEATKSARKKRRRWQEELSPTWIRRVERKSRTCMERYGYTPHPLEQEPSRSDHVWATLEDLPKLARTIYRLMRIAVLTRVYGTDDAARLQTLAHSLDPEAWKLHPDWPQELPTPPAHP